MLRIIPGDFSDPRVISLLRLHAERARAQTARGSAHVLSHTGLMVPEIQFFAAWEEETLMGVAALKRLDADAGEIKSMHTAEAARRRGVGRSLVVHLIETARASGLSRLFLETGSWPYFKPAVALYTSLGFAPCPPFGDYKPDPNSLFMIMDLGQQQ